MERRRFLRTKYIAKGGLQWRIFISTILMLCTFILLLGLGFYLPLLTILYSDLPWESSDLQAAAQFFLSTEKYIWLSIIMVMVLLGIYSILLSHKIAGPIFRIERTLEEVARGNLSLRARIRKNDELQDLAAQLNQTITSLEERILQIKQGVEETERAQSEFQARYRDRLPQDPEIDRALSVPRDAIIKVRESVASFQLSPSSELETTPQ